MGQAKAILIVDDEAILLLALRQELSAEFGGGYRYEVALNAEEGMEVFSELAEEGVGVALVISDWFMPGMKGDEFIVKVRGRDPGIRTMMISGQTDEDRLSDLKASGCLDVFMHKPWTGARLIQECRRLLESA